MKTGEVYKTNNCGEVEILHDFDSSEVEFKFLDTGHITRSSAGNIRKGAIKDPMKPSFLGVGFVGLEDGKPKIMEEKLYQRFFGKI